LETRITLLIWSALRELGEDPDAKSAKKQGAQLNLLTRSGPYIVTEIPPTVMKPASALMVELMHRSKEAKK
jgi:hypothetical protein